MQIASAWDAPSPALKFEEMVLYWVFLALAKHIFAKPRIFSNIGALKAGSPTVILRVSDSLPL
jgi:hypothetical protein